MDFRVAGAAHHSIFAATSPTTGPVRPRWTSSRRADERSYRHACAVLTPAGDGGHRTVAVRQRKPTMSASAGEASMGRPFYRIFLAATRFSRRCVDLCPPHDADFRCALVEMHTSDVTRGLWGWASAAMAQVRMHACHRTLTRRSARLRLSGSSSTCCPSKCDRCLPVFGARSAIAS